jgi:hypothetical protein
MIHSALCHCEPQHVFAIPILHAKQQTKLYRKQAFLLLGKIMIRVFIGWAIPSLR